MIYAKHYKLAKYQFCYQQTAAFLIPYEFYKCILYVFQIVGR